MNIQDKKKLISNVIFVIFIIGIVSIACILFEKYNYNNYQKSEYYAHKTSFLRDSKIKYNKSKSYKISEYSPGFLHAGVDEDNGYQVRRAARLFFIVVSYHFGVSDS